MAESITTLWIASGLQDALKTCSAVQTVNEGGGASSPICGWKSCMCQEEQISIFLSTETIVFKSNTRNINYGWEIALQPITVQLEFPDSGGLPLIRFILIHKGYQIQINVKILKRISLWETKVSCYLESLLFEVAISLFSPLSSSDIVGFFFTVR